MATPSDRVPVKIVKKHETPTRVGGVLRGGVGLATGLVIGLLGAAATGGGAQGAQAGHAASGMGRNDLKEFGEGLDSGQAGLVVVAVPEMESKIEAAMEHARKVQAKEFRADQQAIEADARSVAP